MLPTQTPKARDGPRDGAPVRLGSALEIFGVVGAVLSDLWNPQMDDGLAGRREGNAERPGCDRFRARIRDAPGPMEQDAMNHR